MSPLLISFVIFSFCCTFASFRQSAFAQELPSGKDPEPTTCEYLKNALDYALIEKNKSESQFLILIFRPGSSESSNTFSMARPKVITDYLKSRDKRLKRLVVAQAPSESALGKLEIFVAGELKSEIYFRRNKDGGSSCVE